MLLCYDQHRVIDDASLWDLYSVEELRRLKHEHENRIRQVTSIGIERSSTILRLVGSVGAVAVDLSDDTVEEALLERGLFPDYKLRGVGDCFEIDVRRPRRHSEGRRTRAIRRPTRRRLAVAAARTNRSERCGWWRYRTRSSRVSS